MNKVLNKNVPQFFVKKNNTDPIIINPLPMAQIIDKFQPEIVHTFRGHIDSVENEN